MSNTRVDADFRYDIKSLIEDLKALKELDEDHSEHASKSEKKHRAKKHQEKRVEEIR